MSLSISRVLAPGVALATIALALPAMGQTHVSPGSHHGGWHHDWHTPDVIRLDQQADRLAKIAAHLHEDAHDLSQDYEHSASIEHYVDRIDRLQQHMHEILHDAVASGRQSSELIAHVKSDVRQAKSWINRLYMELQHQGYDGARTADYHHIVHMRQIIVREAIPLVRQMESELYGYDWHHSSHWSGIHSPGIHHGGVRYQRWRSPRW